MSSSACNEVMFSENATPLHWYRATSPFGATWILFASHWTAPPTAGSLPGREALPHSFR
jgi:hypothetical protein